LTIDDFQLPIWVILARWELAIGNWQSAIKRSFGFLMISMLAATATKLAEFKPIGRGLLVFGRDVVATLTIVTLKHNIIAWHNLNPGLWPLAFGLWSLNWVLEPTKT
jgi:hypothetical protein